MNESSDRYKIQSAAIGPAGLIIDWYDGHRSQFHPVWLRHQCSCRSCGTPINAVRGLRLHHIPEDIQPTLVSADAGGVSLSWSNDGHTSEYAAAWLRDNCYSDEERAHRRHRPILWDGAIGNNPPQADLAVVEADDEARLAMLEQIRDYGFCKIMNAPTRAEDAGRLINMVGPQRVTHFGTYELSKKGTVDNVGDITDALDPHVDETYRTSTIGITVFQVLQPSSNGGASTLVDGFEAVQRLKSTWPEDFELLTKVPITGTRRDAAHNSGGKARWYSATMPVIRTDYYGNLTGVRLNERQIAPLDLPGELVAPCYRALKRLFDTLYDPALRLTFELQAGEGLIFDNQRVLHGRTRFETEDPPRAVLTSSVDIEEFHSSLRLLQEQIEGTVPPIRLTQGMVA